MPRALWSGSIVFGLVNAPVRMYSAVAEHKLHFHYLHRKDDSPIGYQKVCKKEGKPVPDDEIVKAFEYEKGEFVYMEDEDFEAARIEGYRTIDVCDFVPYGDIDPIFFAKTYYVGPEEGAEHVYSLLARAMEDSGLAAVAKFVMRDQQHLGVLRVREGVITLEQLYFADEVQPIDELREARTKVDRRELDMAKRLIDSFTSDWEPERYHDTTRDALMAVIEKKRKGEEVHVGAEVDEEEVPDLMTALRRSIEQARGGGVQRRGSDGDLSKLSKSELEERARKANVPGRSKMSKDELVEALRHAA
jgi:DNA end-binding protein Ku